MFRFWFFFLLQFPKQNICKMHYCKIMFKVAMYVAWFRGYISEQYLMCLLCFFPYACFFYRADFIIFTSLHFILKRPSLYFQWQLNVLMDDKTIFAYLSVSKVRIKFLWCFEESHRQLIFLPGPIIGEGKLLKSPNRIEPMTILSRPFVKCFG